MSTSIDVLRHTDPASALPPRIFTSPRVKETDVAGFVERKLKDMRSLPASPHSVEGNHDHLKRRLERRAAWATHHTDKMPRYWLESERMVVHDVETAGQAGAQLPEELLLAGVTHPEPEVVGAVVEWQALPALPLAHVLARPDIDGDSVVTAQQEIGVDPQTIAQARELVPQLQDA